MFDEDQLLPISALQHLVFCPRQCALIHVERLWAENRLTVEGKQLHQRADRLSGDESRPGVRLARALPLRSLRWGVVGQADVVEFHDEDAATGKPTIVPVEYKRGQPKKDDSDRVQLCAQALCLEEMCGTQVTEGALFYGKRRRRTLVQFDRVLRQRTTDAIAELRDMIDHRRTPPAVKSPKCDACSLREICVPDATEQQRSASRFMARQFGHHHRSDGPQSDRDFDRPGEAG